MVGLVSLGKPPIYEKKNSDFKPPLPCQLMEKASGVNLEAKSGARVPEAVRVVLVTPATLLEPVVLALAFPSDYFSDVERGDLLLG